MGHAETLIDPTAVGGHSDLIRLPAIVLASGLNGLCTVRSLGVAGVPVFAVVSAPSSPCVYSRYGRAFKREPREPLLNTLGRLRRDHGVTHGVLMATSDDEARELAEAMDRLPQGMHFAGPSSATVALLMDKRTEIETVSRVSDSLPRSLADIPDSPEAVLRALPLPIIFKPRTQRIADRLRMKNVVVSTPEAVSSFLERFGRSLDLFVAQEVIPGEDDTIWQCNAVFNRNHALVSAFTFQKLGMSPPHFGVTTMGRSQRNDEVIAHARRIGEALGYVGPAGMEFKRDPRDGCYRYIETNPRHGMTNWFDTSCGVNSALRAYQLALGDEEAVHPLQDGERIFIDLHADLMSRLVDDAEPWTSVLRRYLSLMRVSRVPAYWWWRDPLPGLAALVRNCGRSASRFAGALRRRLIHG
jgi:predicted ATP-grasp superfamily ATP-dependent carboligase